MAVELLNHKVKCRLCFQRISGTRNISKITEIVQQKFFSLTNIELRSSDKFSSSICKACINSLNDSSEFQHKMIDNQRRLYAFEAETDNKIVKAEPTESNLIEFQEITTENFFPLKTEVFEDDWTLNCQMPDSEEVSRSASPDNDSTVNHEDNNEEGPAAEVVPNEGKQTKRGRSKHSLEQLLNAVEAVASGKLATSEASEKFGVPKRTVYRRLHKDNNLLTDQEEFQLKFYLKKRSESGIPTSDEEIEKFIFLRLLCKRRKKDRVKIKKLPSTWVSTFRNRCLPSDMHLLVDVEFRCDICGFSVKGKRHVRIHMERHVKKDLQYSPRRRKKPHAPEAFEEAMKAVAGGMSVRGAARLHKIIPTTLSNYRDKVAREKSGQEPQIFKCSFCEKSFYNVSSKRNHETSEHLTPVGEFPCKVCGKVYTSRTKLQLHNYKAHVTRPHKCKECPEVFGKRRMLENHQLTHLEDVACHVCGKMVKPGFKMTTHMKCHAPRDKHKCTFDGCSQAYHQRRNLNYHIRNTHKPIDEKVKCLECNATLLNKPKLKIHMERTHGKPKHFCAVDNCCYKSNRKEYLKLHLQNHKDIDEALKNELIRKLTMKTT